MKKLTRKQLKYKKIFLEKIRKGIYKEKKIHCPCGKYDDMKISETDPRGIPLKVVLCQRCGLMRVDPYYTEKTLINFYNFEYRGLYEEELKVSNEFFGREVEGGRFIYDYLKKYYFKRDFSGKTIFEIGCSAGGILFSFKEKGNHVFGCDYDSSYLAYGKSKGLNLKVGGIERLLELKKKADVVILCHVLEHVPDPVSELKKVKKILKKDGVIFIAVPGIYYIHKSSQSSFEDYIQNAHVFYFTLKTLTKIAKISGLGLEHGDESVFAIFREGGIGRRSYKEDYKKILSYLKKIETFKLYFLFISYIQDMAIILLRKTKLLGIFTKLYQSARSRLI